MSSLYSFILLLDSTALVGDSFCLISGLLYLESSILIKATAIDLNTTGWLIAQLYFILFFCLLNLFSVNHTPPKDKFV